jgi:Ran GTPase-activating protein (RanGAP) involved in mRNA processing and transport
MASHYFREESAILISLMMNDNFVELDLSRNDIGTVGAMAIVKLVERTTTLVSLRLQNNGIGVTGAAMLCSALVHNISIVNFDFASPDGMCRNRMQGVGATAMA